MAVPPFLHALASGAYLSLGFTIDRLALLWWASVLWYVVAMMLGGWYWAREGWEKLVEEREVGIEVLMAAATDAAIEAADVALMADDLAKVAYAIRLGRRARWIGQQNIAFSLLILVALIPSALMGLLGVAVAVTVHEVTELLAVGNGLRAARV